jgi:hypothetical protein
VVGVVGVVGALGVCGVMDATCGPVVLSVSLRLSLSLADEPSGDSSLARFLVGNAAVVAGAT